MWFCRCRGCLPADAGGHAPSRRRAPRQAPESPRTPWEAWQVFSSLRIRAPERARKLPNIASLAPANINASLSPKFPKEGLETPAARVGTLDSASMLMSAARAGGVTPPSVDFEMYIVA